MTTTPARGTTAARKPITSQLSMLPPERLAVAYPSAMQMTSCGPNA